MCCTRIIHASQDAVEKALDELLPSVVCEYVYELCGKFTDFYSACKARVKTSARPSSMHAQGGANERETPPPNSIDRAQVIGDDAAVQSSRLMLVSATLEVLKKLDR